MKTADEKIEGESGSDSGETQQSPPSVAAGVVVETDPSPSAGPHLDHPDRHMAVSANDDDVEMMETDQAAHPDSAGADAAATSVVGVAGVISTAEAAATTSTDAGGSGSAGPAEPEDPPRHKEEKEEDEAMAAVATDCCGNAKAIGPQPSVSADPKI